MLLNRPDQTKNSKYLTQERQTSTCHEDVIYFSLTNELLYEIPEVKQLKLKYELLSDPNKATNKQINKLNGATDLNYVQQVSGAGGPIASRSQMWLMIKWSHGTGAAINKHETRLGSLDLFRHAHNDTLPYDWKNGHFPCVKCTKLSTVPPAIPAPH